MPRRFIWLVLLIATLLPLLRPLLKGEAIGPWDQVGPMMGAPAVEKTTAWDILQADACLQFYPWRDLVFESWGNFQAPYYNPYQLNGVPLLANSQSGGFYPPHILAGLSHLPTPTAISVLAWFHLFWAAFGIFKLSRRFGASDAGALLGAVSFALSPFMMGWTGLASVISTVAWIPWVLLFCLPGDKGTLVKLALCTAMMILAGHLQFVALGGMAAVTVVASVAIQKRRMPIGLMGLALGALLAAPQLVPVLEYSKHSHRRAAATETGFEAYQASSIQPWEFGNLVYPYALGNPAPREGNLTISNYWPAIVKVGKNWTESAVAPGAVVLACLFFLPLLWKKINLRAVDADDSEEFEPIWPMAIVGLLGLLIAMGTPFNRLLYFGIPGWSSTGSPGRAIVLFLLAAAVIAARIVREIKFHRTREGTFAPFSIRAQQLCLLAFSLVAFVVFAQSQPMVKVAPEWIKADVFKVLAASSVPNALIFTLVFAFAAVQPFILTYSSTRIRNTDPTMLFPVVALILAMVTANIRTGIAPERGTPDLNKRVAFVNHLWDFWDAAPAQFPGNTSTLKRQLDAGGYDSLLHRDVVESLKEVNGGDPAPAANGNLMFIKPGADPAKLASMGVSEFTQAYGTVEKLNGTRATLNGEPAIIVNQTLESMKVKVPGPGELVVHDRNLGGWSYSVGAGSEPVKQGDWLTVTVPDGVSEVTLSYTPPGLILGRWLFLVGLILLAVLKKDDIPAPTQLRISRSRVEQNAKTSPSESEPS